MFLGGVGLGIEAVKHRENWPPSYPHLLAEIAVQHTKYAAVKPDIGCSHLTPSLSANPYLCRCTTVRHVPIRD